MKTYKINTTGADAIEAWLRHVNPALILDLKQSDGFTAAASEWVLDAEERAAANGMPIATIKMSARMTTTGRPEILKLGPVHFDVIEGKINGPIYIINANGRASIDAWFTNFAPSWKTEFVNHWVYEEFIDEQCRYAGKHATALGHTLVALEMPSTQSESGCIEKMMLGPGCFDVVDYVARG